MRRLPWVIPFYVAGAAAFLFPATGWSAQQGQKDTQSQATASSSAKADASAAPAPAPQQDSLAEAARKAKAKRKDGPATGKVFTNDNLPKQGGISSVGASAAAQTSDTTASAAAPAPTSAGNREVSEKAWRERFASLRHKLEQDQASLDVMQREVGVLSTQFYGGDPNAAFQDQRGQQPLGAAHAKKVSEIDSKKKEVEADQQAIDDAEDELRKSGGDPGWAR